MIKREDGSATIEVLLWLPLFVVVIGLMPPFANASISLVQLVDDLVVFHLIVVGNMCEQVVLDPFTPPFVRVRT